MTLQTAAILLAATLNLFALLGVVLKAGQLLAVLTNLTGTVNKLEKQVEQHTESLARTVAQLDALEQRVARLERQDDAR